MEAGEVVGHNAKEVLTLLLKDLLIKRGRSNMIARIFSMSMWHDKDTCHSNKTAGQVGREN